MDNPRDESLIEQGICNYGSNSYWDEYYKDANRDVAIDEWYNINFNQLKFLVENSVSHSNILLETSRVLHLGCGRSTVGIEMNNEYGCIVENIDFSNVVIAEMSDKSNENNTGCRWHCMECDKLKFQCQSFDIALDKAVFDSIYCGTSPRDSAWAYSSEVHRVLKEGGIWIIISYAPPEKIYEYFFNDDELFGPILACISQCKCCFATKQ